MNISATIEWVVLVLILAGTMLSLLSSLGFIRFPDVYTRAHAATKSVTLGLICILFAAFVYFWYFHDNVSIRFLLAIIFVIITAPVAAHLITRSAYRSGVPIADISVQDTLKDDLRIERESKLEQRAEETVGTDELESAESADEVEDSENAVVHAENDGDGDAADADEGEGAKDSVDR